MYFITKGYFKIHIYAISGTIQSLINQSSKLMQSKKIVYMDLIIIEYAQNAHAHSLLTSHMQIYYTNIVLHINIY